jgi:DNA-binding GntR family transcriptional regulator
MPRTSTKAAVTAHPQQLQEHIRQCLESEILDGKVLPGERLDEQMLAQRFNASRTPIREALLQLSVVGLVQFRSRQGAIVARLTMKQIFAMWEFLVGLEGMCAELAARRMSIAERDQLQKLHHDSRVFVEKLDIPGYDAANQKIHEVIYAGAKNKYLEQQVLEIRRRLRIYRRYPFERVGGVPGSFEGHDTVVQAILSGDDKAAGEAMRDHVTTGGRAFHDFIAEMPSGLVEDEAHADS